MTYIRDTFGFLKLLLGEFITRMASLLKLFLLEFIAMLCLGGAYATLRNQFRTGQPAGLVWLMAASLTGLLILVALLRKIWFPRIIADSYGFPLFARKGWRGLAGWIMPGWWNPVTWFVSRNENEWTEARDIPTGRTSGYWFLTTHPSYVLVDLLALMLALFMWRMTTLVDYDVGDFTRFRNQAWILIAIAIPTFRLVCWYGLGRRADKGREVVRTSWRPVAALYLFVILPLSGLIWFFAGEDARAQKKAPVANAQTLAGGLSRHPDFLNIFVRVEGIQKSAEPFLWDSWEKDEPMMNHATLLLEIGDRIEVLVKASGDYRDEMIRQARGNQGKPFVAYGRLFEWGDIGSREVRYHESLGPPPPEGRALLVVKSASNVKWQFDHDNANVID